MEQERSETEVLTSSRENEAQILGIEKDSSWDEINKERKRIYTAINSGGVSRISRIYAPCTGPITTAVENIKDAYRLGLSFGVTRGAIEVVVRGFLQEMMVVDPKYGYKYTKSIMLQDAYKAAEIYSIERRIILSKGLDIKDKNPTWMEIAEKEKNPSRIFY